MTTLPDIQPGDIAIHHNGDVGRVIYEPTERDSRIGVAFWCEDDVMQMAWDLAWVDRIERDGKIVWGRGAAVQLELWNEVS